MSSIADPTSNRNLVDPLAEGSQVWEQYCAFQDENVQLCS